jgi:hypothetical protein
LSVNYKVYFWSQSHSNEEEIVHLLNSQKNEKEYGPIEIIHVNQFPDDLAVYIDGKYSIEYWRNIQENIYALTKKQWLVIVFCDYDWSYQVKGDLGEGLFQKNIFLSRAPKLIEEIESDQSIESILRVITEKVTSKKIKVKNIQEFKKFSEWN